VTAVAVSFGGPSKWSPDDAGRRNVTASPATGLPSRVTVAVSGLGNLCPGAAV